MSREQFPHDITSSEFIALGIDQGERTKRKDAVTRFPEFVQFGSFLKSERRLNPYVLKEISSSANIFGKYDLSIHESLSQRENFDNWKGMGAPEINQMEESMANATIFRWILKGFYLYCEEHDVQLPPALDIFQSGSAVYLQSIAEFIELLY